MNLMRNFLFVAILTLIAPLSLSFAAEDDDFDKGPSAAEVKDYKRSGFSLTAFYNLANEFKGEGHSTGAGSDGNFTSFFDSDPSFGIGANYEAWRFWRMRMDVGLQVEVGRSISKQRVKGETTDTTNSVSIDVDPIFSLFTNFYYPVAPKIEVWAGINISQITFDDPDTSLDPDLGYQAGFTYNINRHWSTELGYFTKRVTGVTEGTPNYPFDHLELNGFTLMGKYFF